MWFYLVLWRFEPIHLGLCGFIWLYHLWSFYVVLSGYPLVNSHIIMERSTIFNG
jgi:hypothetical protein